MPLFKNPAQRLRDILDNIDLVDTFTSGLEYSGFESDRKTVYAVVRALEIVSEATRRLPVELKERHPGIDWVAVAAAGNVYRHEYEGIDEALVWYTARNDTRALRTMAGSWNGSLLVTPLENAVFETADPAPPI
jgi:uncharacterized protein with HEPN domain